MDQITEDDTNQIAPPIPTETVPQPVEPNIQSPIPVVAKIISALYYFVSIFLIFVGIMTVSIGGLTFSSVTEFLGLNFGLGLSIVPGLLAIAWGVLHFVTGRGLWTGKEWG